MSKKTNPQTESSVTCGFYNSVSGDRKYDAVQMSSIFDGIISDGIFGSIGDKFIVRSSSDDNTVIVGSGRCWFNHSWTLNDAELPVVCGAPDIIGNRIDAIVIEVNSSPDVRDNFIKCITGTASSSNPKKPTLTNNETIHQYPLCYITRYAGVNAINQADIENVVGIDTPLVTGILQTITMDELALQWTDELNRYMERCTSDIDSFEKEQKADFDAWYAGMKSFMDDVTTEMESWIDTQQAVILDWFNHMKNQLSTDAAANLQLQIDDAKIERYLVYGLPNGTKVFSEDGTEIVTNDTKNNLRLTKTFNDDFSTCTTTLYDTTNVSSGSLATLGTLEKTFGSDGSTVKSTLIIRGSIYTTTLALQDATGLVLTSPNGTQYALVVNDNQELHLEEV